MSPAEALEHLQIVAEVFRLDARQPSGPWQRRGCTGEGTHQALVGWIPFAGNTRCWRVGGLVTIHAEDETCPECGHPGRHIPVCTADDAEDAR